MADSLLPSRAVLQLRRTADVLEEEAKKLKLLLAAPSPTKGTSSSPSTLYKNKNAAARTEEESVTGAGEIHNSSMAMAMPKPASSPPNTGGADAHQNSSNDANLKIVTVLTAAMLTEKIASKLSEKIALAPATEAADTLPNAAKLSSSGVKILSQRTAAGASARIARKIAAAVKEPITGAAIHRNAAMVSWVLNSLSEWYAATLSEWVGASNTNTTGADSARPSPSSPLKRVSATMDATKTGAGADNPAKKPKLSLKTTEAPNAKRAVTLPPLKPAAAATAPLKTLPALKPADAPNSTKPSTPLLSPPLKPAAAATAPLKTLPALKPADAPNSTKAKPAVTLPPLKPASAIAPLKTLPAPLKPAYAPKSSNAKPAVTLPPLKPAALNYCSNTDAVADSVAAADSSVFPIWGCRKPRSG